MCGFGWLVYDNGLRADINPTRCNSWGCDECAPRRKAKCEIQAKSGRPTTYLVLTANPRVGVSPLDRMGRMTKKLPLLIRRMQRYTGKRIPYYVTPEETKIGEPHLNVLMRCDFVPQKLISQWWNELTGAFIVYIERVNNPKKAASYIHKYVNKALAKFGKFKRYWQTKDYQLPPDDGEDAEPWEPRSCVHTMDEPEEVATTYRTQGWWRVPGAVEGSLITMMWPALKGYAPASKYRRGWG
jgi:hypothetical protein